MYSFYIYFTSISHLQTFVYLIVMYLFDFLHQYLISITTFIINFQDYWPNSYTTFFTGPKQFTEYL